MANLELAARFLAALHDLTRGKLGAARSIADCAARAGMTRPADVRAAVATAEKAGFLDVRVDDPAWVLLTPRGLHEVTLGDVERRPYASSRTEDQADRPQPRKRAPRARN